MANVDHDSAVLALYEKAGIIEELPAMVGIVANRMGVRAARIGLPSDFAEPSNPFLDFNIDPAAVGQYLGYWVEHDLWFKGFQERRVKVGMPTFATQRELVNSEVFQRSPFYNDFLAPQKLVSCAVVEMDAVSSGHLTGCTVAFLSEAGDKELTAEDLLAGHTLLKHLSQAFRLTFDLERARRQHAALIDGLEAIGQSIALLSAVGKVLYASPGFLSGMTGLFSIRNDRLTANHPRENNPLEAAIRHAAKPDGVGDVVILHRKGSWQPVLLKVQPLPERIEATSSEARARVLIQLHDPAQRRAPAWSVVVRLYDLTPAELRLCQALHTGQTLSDYCDGQQISQATARTQLHNVFRKTGTKRQSELMAMLADLSVV